VGQVVGYRSAGDVVSAAEASGSVRESGSLRFAVVEVGDFESQIAIEIHDSVSECHLNYWAGPGVDLRAAESYAELLVASL
jgi:hypothetical protein